MPLITICQIIFGVSLAGMLFIFLRNLPLLPEFEPRLDFTKKRFSSHLKYNIKKTTTKIGESLHGFIEKISHRLRAIALKADNFFMSRARKAREKKVHFAKINVKRQKREDHLAKLEEELKEAEKMEEEKRLEEEKEPEDETKIGEVEESKIEAVDLGQEEKVIDTEREEGVLEVNDLEIVKQAPEKKEFLGVGGKIEKRKAKTKPKPKSKSKKKKKAKK